MRFAGSTLVVESLKTMSALAVCASLSDLHCIRWSVGAVMLRMLVHWMLMRSCMTASAINLARAFAFGSRLRIVGLLGPWLLILVTTGGCRGLPVPEVCAMGHAGIPSVLSELDRGRPGAVPIK
jgi:hypothetical protein